MGQKKRSKKCGRLFDELCIVKIQVQGKKGMDERNLFFFGILFGFLVQTSFFSLFLIFVGKMEEEKKHKQHKQVVFCSCIFFFTGEMEYYFAFWFFFLVRNLNGKQCTVLFSLVSSRFERNFIQQFQINRNEIVNKSTCMSNQQFTTCN